MFMKISLFVLTHTGAFVLIISVTNYYTNTVLNCHITLPKHTFSVKLFIQYEFRTREGAVVSTHLFNCMKG